MPLLSLSLSRTSLALALAGASVVAWAQPQPQKPPPKQQAQQQPQPRSPHRNQQGLSESVRRAERNGQVLSAEQVQSDGRDVNRVKIIDSKGRVRVYWDDPAARSRDGKNGGKGRQDKPRTRSDDDGDPTL